MRLIGGVSAVHQFVHIGQHSYIGGGSLVSKDVPPYIKGSPQPFQLWWGEQYRT